MNIDDIYLLYYNSGKYFPTYNLAYYNSNKIGCDKKIYYVFTPTMQKFKRVSEIEKCCRDYFNKNFSMDYFDVISKTGIKQLKLIKEV